MTMTKKAQSFCSYGIMAVSEDLSVPFNEDISFGIGEQNCENHGLASPKSSESLIFFTDQRDSSRSTSFSGLLLRSGLGL